MNISKILGRTRLFTDMERLENQLASREDVIHPGKYSPSRFDIIRGRLESSRGGPPIRMLPTMLQCMAGIKESFRTLTENPRNPQTLADGALFSEIEAYALRQGVSSVGYTKLPARWVFQDKAAAYENVMMLSMEMDKDGIDSAPSPACMKTVMETYRDLGQITNRIAEMLRSKGFGAQAGHPLNGIALYPPLAQMAGLGWMGLNGIIITPEHGPRVRLAAVFTSIGNLPLSAHNPHSWVADFCRRCRICVKKCPPNALLGRAVDHGNGQFSYVDSSLCFPYFNDFHGCSVCIAVCPFHHTSYQKIKDSFLA